VCFVVKDVAVPTGRSLAIVVKRIAAANPLIYFLVKDVAVPMGTSVVIIGCGATA
jgi:hypothetical protein